MSTSVATLRDLSVLVHHIELNQTGWWDRTIQRLVLAAAWYSDAPVEKSAIEDVLVNSFRLSIPPGQLETTLNTLVSQKLLIDMNDGSFRIPDATRKSLDDDVNAAAAIANSAKASFVMQLEQFCPDLDGNQSWTAFDTELLIPLIRESGANAYRLIAGRNFEVDHQLLSRFLNHFANDRHAELTKVVATFINPKNEAARAYVSRLLHAQFCIAASGLPAQIITKLQTLSGKITRLRLFVDTNFLFSLLELHENPSNAAATDLKELIDTIKPHLRVDLVITPKTIEEAKRAISAARFLLSGIPHDSQYTRIALRLPLSGMSLRFFNERSLRKTIMTAGDWFDPYMNNFVDIARQKGVELFNEAMDGYSMRQDIVDDIADWTEYEKKNVLEERQKSYASIAHDVILWHFVKDSRDAYVESPLDAKDWILTIDFRLIGFDKHKQHSLVNPVPICIHPSSLIQLLQFWVPRSKEFEDAAFGSLCLPFLFQEFDAEAERTSLRILRGLGRFSGRKDFSEDTIARLVFDNELRSRLRGEHDDSEEVLLIRDALVEEYRNRADAEARKSAELTQMVLDREKTAQKFETDAKSSSAQITELLNRLTQQEESARRAEARIAAQETEIRTFKANDEAVAERRQITRARRIYTAILLLIILVSVGASYFVSQLLPSLTTILGFSPAVIGFSVLAFVLCHSVFECALQEDSRILKNVVFATVQRFRRWLWGFVILVFAVGVIGNLYANYIQKQIDNQPTMDSSETPKGNSGEVSSGN